MGVELVINKSNQNVLSEVETVKKIEELIYGVGRGVVTCLHHCPHRGQWCKLC